MAAPSPHPSPVTHGGVKSCLHMVGCVASPPRTVPPCPQAKTGHNVKLVFHQLLITILAQSTDPTLGVGPGSVMGAEKRVPAPMPSRTRPPCAIL